MLSKRADQGSAGGAGEADAGEAGAAEEAVAAGEEAVLLV